MRAPWMMFTIQNTGVQNTPMKMVPLQRQKSVVRLHQPTSASASYWMVIAHCARSPTSRDRGPRFYPEVG
jgi:hypothetical protein